MKSKPRNRAVGFTLIELMVTVAIVGILGSLAYPSYMGSVRKGRRVDAADAAATVLQAQERYRSNNPQYTTTLSDLKITSASTGNGYYTMALAANGAVSLRTDYVLTFSAVAGKGQDKDTGCTSLSVRVSGGQPSYVSGGQTNADPARCWSR